MGNRLMSRVDERTRLELEHAQVLRGRRWDESRHWGLQGIQLIVLDPSPDAHTRAALHAPRQLHRLLMPWTGQLALAFGQVVLSRRVGRRGLLWVLVSVYLETDPS